MKTVLSFDVGIKNLAMCAIEADATGPNRIVLWSVGDVSSGPTREKDKTTCAMGRRIDGMVSLLFDRIPPHIVPDAVVIENQAGTGSAAM